MRNAQTFLRMKTALLRLGDAPFADGNAAARTFGRAHRHRPYHFSCGSVFQGCRKRLCRRTKTREVVWKRGLMEIGRGGAYVSARVALQGAHPSLAGVHHAQCTNISTHGKAPFAAGGRALCGWKRRCADVRAGTQAPPLPFLVWLAS